MSDDLLSQFTSALAEEHDGATAVPEATRARVIRTLAERRRRGRKWWAVGIPAFAIFGGSTAWAAATGRIPLPAVVEQAVAVFIEKTPEPLPEKKTAQLGVHHRSSASPPEAESAPEAPLEDDIDESSPTESGAPNSQAAEARTEQVPSVMKPTDSTAPRITPSTAPKNLVAEAPAKAHPAPTPQVDEALLTYRSAHRAQFQSDNCAEAIAGYERYLREDPSGSFSLEAKYNRGVCLAKMGQKSSAIQALEPFANGQFGGYRQEKSRALIKALGQ